MENRNTRQRSSASSSRSEISSIFSSLPEEDEEVSSLKTCFCGLDAKIRMSRTSRNPNRKFFGCRNFVVALLLSQMSPALVGERMEDECFYDSVNVILYLRSSNGGFPGWEPQRGFRWLEKLNPTEFFENCLIEQEYVECTSSVIQSLILFRKLYPEHRRNEIDNCISRGMNYIENTQNPDGSWYGRWGICYTYGTWFGVEGLVACGKNYKNSPSLRKACHFLLSKQLPNGGWGESYLSSRNKVYTNLEGHQANLVQTSWALLALIGAGQAEIDPTPIQRGNKNVDQSTNARW